jgi:TonB family protein
MTFSIFAYRSSPEVQTLCESLSTQIAKSNAKSLVVFDLKGPDGPPLAFGTWLADEISESLPKSGHIKVIPRADLARELKDRQMSQTHLRPEDKMRISEALGADLFVDGTFGAIADYIGVTLVARNQTDFGKGTYTIMVNGKILVNSEVQTHLGVPLESLRPSDGIFKSGRAGMTVPKCDYCPIPQFSPAGIWSRKEGTVILALLISTDGRAERIKILKSVDAELDDEAIKAARTFKFEPALDPDGKPAAVMMPYSVSFHVSN